METPISSAVDAAAADDEDNLFATTATEQGSPLFTLPPEVRYHIFTYVLTDYLDPARKKKYSKKTCYTRPGYSAPRRCDTALLQTCRAVYFESWFLPLQLCEQIHWLAESSRFPPGYRAEDRRREVLWNSTLRKLKSGGRLEIQRMTIFIQMHQLEMGQLDKLFSSREIYPRQVVMTIRHTDWWYWEVDHELRFRGLWVKDVPNYLPDSVREFRIDLETVSRKRTLLQDVAKQMCEQWYLRRKDGKVLYPDVTGHLTTETSWVGSSQWNGIRWIRDECEEGKIKFVVMSVPFRLEHAIKREEGDISSVMRHMAETGTVSRFRMMSFSTRGLHPALWPFLNGLSYIVVGENGVDEGENDEEEE